MDVWKIALHEPNQHGWAVSLMKYRANGQLLGGFVLKSFDTVSERDVYATGLARYMGLPLETSDGTEVVLESEIRNTVTMSPALQSAINQLSQDCAPDMGTEGGGDDPLVVAEVCLDADRLLTAGLRAEHAEMIRLVQDHGWSAVVAEAARHVGTL